VLGAGTMGSRIAAHFANAGVSSLLLDITREAAMKGLDGAAKSKPPAFLTSSGIGLVQTGSFDERIADIVACDWVLEAVTENLDIKRDLWRRVDQHARPDAILSTNTSGIPLHRIVEGFSEAFRQRFLGVHFFNPPRYLHLVEIIPGQDTDRDLIGFVSQFCDERLGKGVVICKDTPNFIGNRIGCFFGGTIVRIAMEEGFTVEEVDAFTGPLIGLPNSATFRLLDIVGLDIWSHVGKNLYEMAPHDPWRERFLLPTPIEEMIGRGWIGEKSGQGFYRRVGKGIEALDLKTFEYRPAVAVDTDRYRKISNLTERIHALVNSGDRTGLFVWRVLRDVMIYSAAMIPEITDRVVDIDRAMKWGYAHTLGPFELWDALGFEATARRMESEGLTLPPLVTGMLRDGKTSFYQDISTEDRPGIITLSTLKRSNGVVKSNAGASLIDLGDGVLCVEFHSKMNVLSEDIFAIIEAGLDETAANGEALVIANQGMDFSVGADLVLICRFAQDGDWNQMETTIHRFQQFNMGIKCAMKPVVAAPFGRVLGGGAEVAMHALRRQASAELYMGLVETAVGLIPAGGGCKEMLIRVSDPKVLFEQIGMAQTSSSADDARRLKYLSECDRVSMNGERLVADAKRLALSLAPGYVPVLPREDILVSGSGGLALMNLGAWMGRQGGFLSEHDELVGQKLAGVLSGGRLSGEHRVSEQYLLDLEREAFLSLCGHPKTLARIQHTLKTGKPLRN